MSFSQKNTISFEVNSDTPLSSGTLAYLEERAKNNFFDYVYGKFKEAEQDRGLTKADLARRLNKRPDHISRLLGAPGNWTIGTVVALLAAIAKEELIPHSESFIGRPKRNVSSRDLIKQRYWPSGATTTVQGGNSSVVINANVWSQVANG